MDKHEINMNKQYYDLKLPLPSTPCMVVSSQISHQINFPNPNPKKKTGLDLFKRKFQPHNKD